jgi:hypothetical protein
MNTRDARHSTTTGAKLAQGTGGAAVASAAPSGFTVPTFLTPLALGLIGSIVLLVYLDRRVVFK